MRFTLCQTVRRHADSTFSSPSFNNNYRIFRPGACSASAESRQITYTNDKRVAYPFFNRRYCHNIKSCPALFFFRICTRELTVRYFCRFLHRYKPYIQGTYFLLIRKRVNLACIPKLKITRAAVKTTELIATRSWGR